MSVSEINRSNIHNEELLQWVEQMNTIPLGELQSLQVKLRERSDELRNYPALKIMRDDLEAAHNRVVRKVQQVKSESAVKKIDQ